MKKEVRSRRQKEARILKRTPYLHISTHYSTPPSQECSISTHNSTPSLFHPYIKLTHPLNAFTPPTSFLHTSIRFQRLFHSPSTYRLHSALSGD
ncbi:hypothetical protein E2C01_035156 [Portunus trituberculatus]|uniref:Uncharacterized protein n=1 Tax=Portunus trituberculatus TaxID=210409 RepID=A0A5B7F7P5_PORTR|nr:hypothetical protein [Portunus trituberculatus]